ncbi:Thioredoxin-like protein Clot [Platanthera guangdongensis]|uniref:Thioredoxin-like protein Clot n=1 Tax=Platanthera guangdongensis TaxID=2320717 RepID=A0ABR2MKJ7_9ASPA
MREHSTSRSRDNLPTPPDVPFEKGRVALPPQDVCVRNRPPREVVPLREPAPHRRGPLDYGRARGIPLFTLSSPLILDSASPAGVPLSDIPPTSSPSPFYSRLFLADGNHSTPKSYEIASSASSTSFPPALVPDAPTLVSECQILSMTIVWVTSNVRAAGNATTLSINCSNSCMDCNAAEPVIYSKISASTSDVAILKAFARDRSTWRDPSHPWRVNARFKLNGVPTLIRWKDGIVAG